MYDFARKTRAERRAKAERLGASTERKTDSSDWTPAEPLNAEAKTGMRPVSRRAYKSGGKVEGCGAKANMGRKARKSGGAADSPRAYANAKVNRNAKDANEERAGVKHVGGLKTGGRAKKNDGGRNFLQKGIDRLRSAVGLDSPDYKPDMSGKKPEAPKMDEADRARLESLMEGAKAGAMGDTRSRQEAQRKLGGRTKKADGGNIVEQATKMLDKSAKTAGVPGATMTFGRIQKGAMSPARAVGVMKKGGKVSEMEWEHSKKDLEQDKKLAKKHGMSLEAWEKSAADKKHDKQQSMEGLEKGGRSKKAIGGAFGQYLSPALMAVNAIRGDKDEKKSGGRIKRKSGGAVENRTVHKTDGEFHYPEKDYGQLASTSAFTRKVQDRTPLKTGGRAKGKTDINIIIAAGAKPGQQDGMMPPPGMDMGLPPRMPIPVPGGAPTAAAPAPMPMPMPMPMPSGGAPAGGPAPMPRKSGGRAMSFKDMTAGAGSGEGRLQKTDIAEYKRTKRRAGGKVYKSYQDMDAGAGSGLGRLEKTEIQSRKR